ncbi:MAG: ABC transporter permease [Alistipes indistinctus]
MLVALAGKLAPYTVIFFALCMLMNTCLFKFLSVPLQGNVMLLFVSGLVYVMVSQAIGVFMIAALSNLRLALSIGGGYSVLSFTFSGLTFPFMAMDVPLQIFGYIFPMTYYVEIFIDQAMRGAPAVNSFAYLGYMMLLPAAAADYAAANEENMHRRREYWGNCKMITTRFQKKFREFASVLRNEYRNIFCDAGVLLIAVGAIFIYSTAYSLAYKNEVLRDVPVAVVDNSRTPSSRQLIRSFDATPNVNVVYKPASLDEAKTLLERKVNGIIVIPGDYEKKLMRTEKVNLAIYADASYFLMYRQVFRHHGQHRPFEQQRRMAAVRLERSFIQAGRSTEQSRLDIGPEHVQPYLGYATFIMPAILMVIIQQTLLIGIGMVGGTWREKEPATKH